MAANQSLAAWVAIPGVVTFSSLFNGLRSKSRINRIIQYQWLARWSLNWPPPALACDFLRMGA